MKIRDTLKGTSWLFCPGVQNPEDIATRGSYFKDDVLRRYLVGGTSVSATVSGRLASTKNFENYKSNESRCLPELSNSDIYTGMKSIFSFKKYNSFEKLITITSFALRFVDNIKLRGCSYRGELA